VDGNRRQGTTLEPNHRQAASLLPELRYASA
jgi:hypothetical protein